MVTVKTPAADTAIQKKILGHWTTLIILNKEMNDIMKRVQFLEESGSLIKFVSKKNKNEEKNKIMHFLACASLLRNMLASNAELYKLVKDEVRLEQGRINTTLSFG